MVRSIALVFGLVLTIYTGAISAYRLSTISETIPDVEILADLNPYEQARTYTASLDDWIASDAHDAPISAELMNLFYEAPLDTRLFAANAVFALKSGNGEGAERVATHLNRLDPRNSIALIAKLNTDIVSADHAGSIDYLDRLITLNSSQKELYFNIAANLFMEPESRKAIQEALIQEPDWAPTFVAKLIRFNPADLSMLEIVKPHTSLHSGYVRSFIRAGDIDTAYQAYLALLPDGARNELGLVYNPTFVHLPGARPFNWTLDKNFSDTDSSGGVSINYYGQDRPTIASQTLKLPAGPYTARFVAEGAQHNFGGHLSWEVACHDAKEALTTFELLDLSAEPARFEFAFEVPAAECSFQTLSLKGVAGTFPRTLRANIESVLIEAAQP